MDKPPVEVLVTLPIDNNLLEKIRQVSPRIKITQHITRKVEEIPADILARAEILYTDLVIPPDIATPNLHWIQYHLAGVELLLDAPITQRKGLVITNLSGAAAPQMAEYILMVMLGLSHHSNDLYASQLKSEWPRDRWERFMPFELRNSTVGIIGYGSVGREVARLLQPFNVSILAIKRDAMSPQDKGYKIEGLGDAEGNLFTRLYPVEAIRSVLKSCDFVVVNLPLTPKTRNIIGSDELAAMKPSAYLVDACRGNVINQGALLSALQERKIAGAALDVFAEEPLPGNSAFWRLPNVIITPHISGASPFYEQRALDLVIENLNRYLAGEPLLNIFHPELGY